MRPKPAAMAVTRLAVAFLLAGPAIACTMVNLPTPREALKQAAVVFLGQC